MAGPLGGVTAPPRIIKEKSREATPLPACLGLPVVSFITGSNFHDLSPLDDYSISLFWKKSILRFRLTPSKYKIWEKFLTSLIFFLILVEKFGIFGVISGTLFFALMNESNCEINHENYQKKPTNWTIHLSFSFYFLYIYYTINFCSLQILRN